MTDRTVAVRTPTGETDARLALPPEVFDVQANLALMHQVVVGQLAAARQGTHSTKTRGEVAGGGKKPYRQKGTGRARQGSTRAPQFTGGGVVHGPTPRSYVQRTPKKMKAAALRGALSDRARDGRVHVLSSLVDGDGPSTKEALAALAGLGAAVFECRHLLVVAEQADELAWKSLRNVASVHLLDPGQLNTYDVLVSDEVVFTRSALDAFLARSGAVADEVDAEATPDDATAPTADADAEVDAEVEGGTADSVADDADGADDAQIDDSADEAATEAEK
jgi:large subunit ribosomal protein L4